MTALLPGGVELAAGDGPPRRSSCSACWALQGVLHVLATSKMR